MKKIIYTISLAFILLSCNNEPHNETSAKVEAQFYVESLLRSPSTADFGGETATKTGKNTYHVEGYVDAQNGFGATVRNYYECDVEFTPDGNSRTISNFKMN